MKGFLKHLLQSSSVIRIVAWLASHYMWLVYKTTRWKKLHWEIPERYWKEGKPFIGCFWHNRLMMTTFNWAGPGTFHMLISAHRDGQLIARTVKHFGIETIAGSSSRGGTEALRAILKILKEGNCIGITPDGPRGPRFQASEGIVQIAKLSGLDILPASYATSRRKVLKTWDRFLIPFPFGRGVLVWGNPIKISEYPGKEGLEAARIAVQAELNRISAYADGLCGRDAFDTVDEVKAKPC